MQSLFNIIVCAFGISASAIAPSKKQCPPGSVFIVGWYAQPSSYTPTTCYQDSVLFDVAGYKQCKDNAWIHKECECEGHRPRKTGMFIQCD
ncbi:hypothetical protein DSO57_1024756 [Entomophthora muscae]|uniref:Uncharacterized protein n=1 Tax=Entomophthora muscae TaxID=34485 RepID=A0ACC2S4C1_9FUNG|nr:hypothetical protein DSO57_1024756 [Entomophthora muscae]